MRLRPRLCRMHVRVCSWDHCVLNILLATHEGMHARTHVMFTFCWSKPTHDAAALPLNSSAHTRTHSHSRTNSRTHMYQEVRSKLKRLCMMSGFIAVDFLSRSIQLSSMPPHASLPDLPTSVRICASRKFILEFTPYTRTQTQTHRHRHTQTHITNTR